MRQDLAGRESVAGFRSPADQVLDEAAGRGMPGGANRVEDREAESDVEDSHARFCLAVEVGTHQVCQVVVDRLAGVAAAQHGQAGDDGLLPWLAGSRAGEEFRSALRIARANDFVQVQKPLAPVVGAARPGFAAGRGWRRVPAPGWHSWRAGGVRADRRRRADGTSAGEGGKPQIGGEQRGLVVDGGGQALVVLPRARVGKLNQCLDAGGQWQTGGAESGDELAATNQELAGRLARAEADRDGLQSALTEAQDDLISARQALRNMMRDQNRPGE